MRRGHQTKGGGDGHRRAQSTGTVEATDAGGVRFLMACVAVPDGKQRLLVGINAGDVEAAFQVLRETVVLAQQLAGLGEQGIMFGAAQVGDTNPRRIDLPAGATDCDHPDASAPAMGDQRGLDAETVDAVNDVVVVRVQQVREIIEGEKVLDCRDTTIGVDLSDARRHDLHLGHTERAGQGVQLAVDVGFGDVIEIDQREAADGRARQGLDRPGTDAADANDADVRFPESFQGAIPVETTCAAEAAFGIRRTAVLFPGAHEIDHTVRGAEHTRKRLGLSAPSSYNPVHGTHRYPLPPRCRGI